MLEKNIQNILCLSVTLIILHRCTAVEELHCLNYNASCSKQLYWLNVNDSVCSIEGIRNNDCTDLLLKTSDQQKLGKVSLQYYLYHDRKIFYKNIGLNLTFSSIKWTRFRFQYKHRYNQPIKFCREINLNESIELEPNVELFYDCLWSTKLEDKEFDLRYEAYDDRTRTVEGRHYVFKAPRSYEIEPTVPLQNQSIFMYIDITEVPLLIFHWQRPLFFNVSSYYVTIYQDDNLVHSTNITNTSENGLYRLPYDIGVSSGKFYFAVEIIHKDCKTRCTVHKSPYIYIADNVIETPMLICVVGSVVLLPVFLYVLYIWKRHSAAGLGHAKVLLTYKQSFTSHTQAVVELARYLKEYCHVHAMIDYLDIPSTEHKDPFKWYQEAFLQANVVLTISSPTVPYRNSCEGGIYPNADVLALRILSEKFTSTQNIKFLTLVLPYCTPEGLPIETRNFKRFSFEKDWNKLLWVMNYGLRSYWVSNIDYYCYQSELPGGGSDLKQYGRSLLDAIAVAKADVQKMSTWTEIVNDNLEDVPLKAVENTSNEYANEVKTLSSLDVYKKIRNENLPTTSRFPGDIEELDLSGEGKIYQNGNKYVVEKSDSSFLDNLAL